MKKANILISTLVILLFSTGLSAQKISSFVINSAPQITLTDGSPIAINELVNNGSTMNSFGKEFANTLYTTLENSNRGKSSKGKLYNPWYTTKLYSLTKDAAAAKYIIGGNYIFSGSVNYDHELIKTKEKKEKNAIPFYYYKNSVTANGSVVGELTISNSSGEVLKKISLNSTKSDSKTSNVNFPVAPTVEEFINAVASEVIAKNRGIFSPYYVIKEYDFKTIKGDKADKVFKKEMKNQKKVFKALADAGSVKELGKAYQKYIASESKIKKPQNLYYNIGLCYELIGNYTKAKENYLKSGDSKAITGIESLIKIQELFKSLGLDVTEGDF